MSDQAILKQRPLGKTGITVSPIGLGGAWLGVRNGTLDEELAIATVDRAFELGVTLVDTSGAYLSGKSEQIIGRAVARWCANGGDRSRLVISTKTGTRPDCRGYSAETTRKSIEQSLKALKTDYLDVALVHDARDIEEPLGDGAALDELLRMKEEGLVRAVGIGLRDHSFHRRTMESGKSDVHLTYADYNLLNRSAQSAVIEPAAQRGIGVFNGMITAYGLLAGENPRELARSSGRRIPEHLVEPAYELWTWARERSLSLLDLTVQFSLRNPDIAATLMGASTPEQIEADVKAAQTHISEAAWKELELL